MKVFVTKESGNSSALRSVMLHGIVTVMLSLWASSSEVRWALPSVIAAGLLMGLSHPSSRIVGERESRTTRYPLVASLIDLTALSYVWLQVDSACSVAARGVLAFLILGTAVKLASGRGPVGVIE